MDYAQVEQELTDGIRIMDGAERAAALKPYVRFAELSFPTKNLGW
jgi:hypothetical protein